MASSLFEDLLGNRPFILKTDHMNLTYLNVTLTGKVLRWKLYLQHKDFHLCHVPGKEDHQGVPDALSRLCENHMPAKPEQVRTATLSALQPKQHLSNEVYDKIAAVHNSSVGHWGHAKCKLRLNDPSVSDRMISTFIRQCPCCQVMSRLKVQIKTHPFTCASYNPFEVIHLDHIGRCTRQHVHPGPDRRFLQVGRAIPHQNHNGSGVGVVHIPAHGTLRHT